MESLSLGVKQSGSDEALPTKDTIRPGQGEKGWPAASLANAFLTVPSFAREGEGRSHWGSMYQRQRARGLISESEPWGSSVYFENPESSQGHRGAPMPPAARTPSCVGGGHLI